MQSTILKDLIDTMKSVYDEAKDLYKSGKSPRVSLSRGAKKGTLQFPVIASRAISLEDITMISKALERQYVSFVRIVASLNATTEEKDIESYLKTLHQNFELDDVDTTTAGKTFLRSIDSKVNEGLNVVHDLNKEAFKSARIIDENAIIVEPMDLSTKQRMNYFNKVQNIAEGNLYRSHNGIFAISESGSIKEIFLIENEGNYSICESIAFPDNIVYASNAHILAEAEKLMGPIMKADCKPYEYPFNESILNDLCHNTELGLLTEKTFKFNSKSGKHEAIKPNSKPTKVYQYNSKQKGYQQEIYHKFLSDDNKNTNVEKSKAPNPEEQATQLSMVADKNGGLTDNDVKKANELVPTMLHLVTHFKKDDKIVQSQDYLIGVKTIIHPVSTDSMISNLTKGVKRDKTFLNILKYTTGEINFFKDLVFTIGNIKDEIKSKYKDSMWWSALRRRQEKAKNLAKIRAKNQLLPNATIVMTQDEVDIIKQQYKIDFGKAATAKSLMSSYYLLAFVIVDPSAEIAKFLFDGENDFSQQSYTSLERENSNQAKEVKNIMQILGKM
ncbi:hypothetical protein V6O07_23015 [Arthrospira platensis SPKY2]